MSSADERQQLHDIRAAIKLGERSPNKYSQNRKDALQKLIQSVQSPYSSVKVVAAGHLHKYIKDFPDLEDDAINAVYDLCEDQDSKVRIEGYKAISNVSQEQKQWVKRNADVLVQLLQSDEPTEIPIVSKALLVHVDLDPLATLSVLCDQIIPPDEDLDEDETATRQKLRGLVLQFLNADAKRAITERHANQAGNECEELLIESMLKTIDKLPQVALDPSVSTTLMVDLLLALPTFKTYSPKGDHLVRLLIDHVRIWNIAPVGGTPNMTKILECCSLIDKVVIDRQAARPEQYLNFIADTFGKKITQLPKDLQSHIFADLANLYNLAENDPPSSLVLRDIRALLAEISSVLLSSYFIRQGIQDWTSCTTILRALAMHQSEATWDARIITDPLHLIQNRAKRELSADKAQEALKDKALSHIKSLLDAMPKPPPKPQASSSKVSLDGSEAPTNGTGRDNNGRANGGPVLLNRNRQGLPASLPPKPSASVLNASRALDANGSTSRTIEQRDAGSSSSSGTPSLLSRLAAHSSDIVAAPARPPSASSSSTSVPSKRRRDQDLPASRPSPPPTKAASNDWGMDKDLAPPVGGFSIKGAASKMASGRPASGRQQSGGSGGSLSLMARLDHGDNGADGVRGRKRTKNS